MLSRRGDRLRLRVIEIEALEPLLFEPRDVIGLSRRANTRQPRAFSSRAEAKPIPEEQPVIKMERSSISC